MTLIDSADDPTATSARRKEWGRVHGRLTEYVKTGAGIHFVCARAMMAAP